MKSKLFFGFLVMLYILGLRTLSQQVDFSFPMRMFLYSTFPIVAMFLDWNVSRITFQELKSGRIRLVSYALSIAYFLLCALAVLGVVPIFPPVLEKISKAQFYAYQACIYLCGLLAAVNLFFVVRDAIRRDRDLPL